MKLSIGRSWIPVLAASCATAVAGSAELEPITLNILSRQTTPLGYTIDSYAGERGNGAGAVPLYYVAASQQDGKGHPLEGVEPLYRLAKVIGSRTEELESTNPAEGGFGSPHVLGYTWTTAGALPGLVPVVRGYAKSAHSAHAGTHTLLGSANAANRAEAFDDYTAEGTLGYAYTRPHESEVLVTVAGGGITAKSNANAGGALWEWWWKGHQFINDYDNGRQLSMAVYTDAGNALQEAGDQFGGLDLPLVGRHPSPTLFVTNSAGSHQSTRAIPLEWAPQNHGGGKDKPVIYANAKIGKELTLDWIGPDGVDRNWPVALYENRYEGPAFPVATVEAPTAYLNTDFTTYYSYDPVTDHLTPLTVSHDKKNVSGGRASGLVLANGPGPSAVAMGVYINDPNAGITLYDQSGPSGGKYGSSFSKWGVVYRSGLAPDWKFGTWIATDTVQNVQKYFHQLYLWNVKSR
jgi:hypothetical protein